MSKLSCIVFLMAVLCSLSTAFPDDVKENTPEAQEYENKGYFKTSLISKCYDHEVKSAFKIDSTWYPEGKCEQRTCSRQNNSKTPIIKIMECEPCTTCNSPNEICHPFRAEKNYPKCCPQCLTKSAILKKKQTKLTN